MMLHFLQRYDISEFIHVSVFKFGTAYWNIDFHWILKTFCDMFFGLLHVHMNNNNQVKSILYVYIFEKGFDELEEGSFKNNHFALFI